jgi:hypothetical protein
MMAPLQLCHGDAMMMASSLSDQVLTLYMEEGDRGVLAYFSEMGVDVGLGHIVALHFVLIVALYYRSSTSYQIVYHIRYLNICNNNANRTVDRRGADRWFEM